MHLHAVVGQFDEFALDWILAEFDKVEPRVHIASGHVLDPVAVAQLLKVVAVGLFKHLILINEFINSFGIFLFP